MVCIDVIAATKTLTRKPNLSLKFMKICHYSKLCLITDTCNAVWVQFPTAYYEMLVLGQSMNCNFNTRLSILVPEIPESPLWIDMLHNRNKINFY